MAYRPTADYIQFGNTNGQNFATFDGSTHAPFTIDYVTHASSSFAATVGQDHITIVKPGMYMAVQTLYIDDSPLATGFLQAWIILDIATGVTQLMACQALCSAELSGFGNATDTRFLTVAASGPVGISAAQTAVATHTLGTDCMIVRLSDLPA